MQRWQLRSSHPITCLIFAGKEQARLRSKAHFIFAICAQASAERFWRSSAGTRSPCRSDAERSGSGLGAEVNNSSEVSGRKAYLYMFLRWQMCVQPGKLPWTSLS